jgi:hypothetical protein
MTLGERRDVRTSQVKNSRGRPRGASMAKGRQPIRDTRHAVGVRGSGIR